MHTEPMLIAPGTFEPENHFYPRVLNAHIHPLVRNLMEMGNDRIASRFCHLHPEISPAAVRALLQSVPKYFRWGGCDLFHVTSETGNRSVVVIETNSCPSGQKSMPRVNESIEMAGYQRLMRDSFLQQLKVRKSSIKGDIAVLYDKNQMENSGYAATLAELTGKNVWLVPFHKEDAGRTAAFDEHGVLHVLYNGERIPIRAAFRYVTQQPWNRIPPLTKTLIYNPVLVCLAGGRNKLVASKAYDIYNASQFQTGLSINTPETIWDVSKEEVPLWVSRMGGIAVVKVPYSNAGQGVYTITSEQELDAFMSLEQHDYDHYIVQSLIGNSKWSSHSQKGRLFHIGTMPDKKLNLYAADIRFMVGTGPNGFFPVAVYARRARKPLSSDLQTGDDSWNMLGTNLSVKQADGSFTTQPERLLLVDSRDFNRLGFGMDDLIESYLQSVMSIVAIDNMSKTLINTKGKFRKKLFGSINPDRRFNEEISF